MFQIPAAIKLATMSSTSIALFSRHWKLLVIAVLFGFIVYQNISETRLILFVDTIPYLKSELRDSEIKADIAVQSNDRLAETIRRQNASIAEFANYSVKLVNEKIVLQAKVASIQKNSDTRVRDVLREETPQSCEASIDYLRKSIEQIQFNDVGPSELLDFADE